ncbi:MAG: ABC transporter ATP-binding protein [Candidatus Eisenbacteria sp.]|nr:ABC transporter ATP-binding protein [Candidatus Eisenbacteria bacterium]
MRGGGQLSGGGPGRGVATGARSYAVPEEHLGRIYDHSLMMRILRYLRPETARVLVAALLLILFSLTSLAGPLITRIGIDHYIANGDAAGLLRICLAWFALLLIGGGLQYAQIVTMNLIGQRTMMRLRQEIYRHLQRLPISFYDRHPVGRLMTRVTNDVEVLNQLFTQGVVAIIGDLVTLLGIMIVLLVMDARIAFVTFAMLPFLFWFSIAFRSRVRHAFRDVRLALARINAYLQENLGGIAVIKAFRREARNDAEFDELNTDHRDAFLRSVRAFAVYFPLVELTQSVAIALILWYGGGLVIQDGLTFGALVAFIQYVGRFFRPIRDLSEKYNILQDAMASSERIFALLDREPEPDAPTTSPYVEAFDPQAAIRFERVSFSYDGKTPVLQEVSCEIAPGTTTAIVGATGSGKTTMISLLARFYDPTAGVISIGGIDTRKVPRAVLRRRMAIVEQDVFLFAGTIADNMRLWEPGISKERLAEAVATSHADVLIRRLPRGWEHPVMERGGSFSTGERQLLAFARALAFDPEILILDEATASVDTETEALIQDALRNLLRERTSIVIAHRLSTIRRADQILVVHHGRILERGTHAELLAQGGLYARLYRLQFRGEAGRSEGLGQSVD